MQNFSKAKAQNLGEYDIAIIGLGVAGSNLCALLKPHLKVIAIDKKSENGHCFDEGFHKPCGGLLSEGAQAAFAKQGLNLPLSVLTHPQIFSINTIDYGFPHASYIQKGYVNMERHRFDLWLKSRIPSHIKVFHNALLRGIECEGQSNQDGGNQNKVNQNNANQGKSKSQDSTKSFADSKPANVEFANTESITATPPAVDSISSTSAESLRKNSASADFFTDFPNAQSTDSTQGAYILHFQQKLESSQECRLYQCRARIVIGADGAKSHIRRYAYPTLAIPSFVCIQEWFKEENPPMLSCIFDSSLSPSYSWSMSKEGYFIFGGAYRHKNCQEAFKIQLARLKELGFRFSAPLKREACLVLAPTRPKHFARGREGIFLIGEAAGFINASTLEGISGAMSSSRILSEILNATQPHTLQEKASIARLNALYIRKSRALMCKTLFRHYVRYPFMFLPFVRRVILRFGILRKAKGLHNGKIC